MIRLAVALVAVSSLSIDAFAYDSRFHQTLTFIAAKQFNRCAETAAERGLTPLQVRYIAKANVGQADDNFLRKLVRWNFYDREGQSERSFAWVIDTRLHHHFNALTRELDAGFTSAAEAEVYAELGRAVSYLQDMTSPPHVVPVYYNRWWRLSFSDRFNGYRVDGDAVERAVAESCAAVFGGESVATLGEVLVATADDTIAAVRGPIEGMPATWEAFWTFDGDAASWGEYGPAGNNFGRRAEFECGGRRCVLLDDDPLYRAFGEARQARAVIATMQAFHWLQSRLPPDDAQATLRGGPTRARRQSPW